MDTTARIFIAGHSGTIGSKLLDIVTGMGYVDIVLRRSYQLDFRIQAHVNTFFREERPEYVFLLAGKTGSLDDADTYAAEFIYDTMMITSNIIHAAHNNSVKKLLYLGCESAFIQGANTFDSNNAQTAGIIAGMNLCQAYYRQHGEDYITVIAPTVYHKPHVFPSQVYTIFTTLYQAHIHNEPYASIPYAHDASCTYIHAYDIAQALYSIAQSDTYGESVYIRPREQAPIYKIAETIQQVIGYTGTVHYGSELCVSVPAPKDISVYPTPSYSVSLTKGIQELLAGEKSIREHNKE